MRRRGAILLGTTCMVLAGIGVASGFVPFRSRWTGATAEMRINANQFSPGSAQLGEVEDQLKAWNEIDGCEFLFTQRLVTRGDSAFNHGDAVSGVAFSNRIQRNVLGVAFSNDRGRRRFASDVNFNSRINWVFGRAPRNFREYHFGSTCAHEFGHALGLQHSDRGCRALMGGGCGSPGRVRPFTNDDLAGARFLYPGRSRATPGGSQPTGQPDWSLDQVQVSPADPQPGQTVSVTVTGTQGGTADAQRVPPIWFVLSTNQTISVQDAVLLRVGEQATAFAVGQRFTLTRQVTLPTTASGERFLGVLIDPQRAVDEVDEDNNTAARRLQIQAPAAPDQDWTVQVVVAPNPVREGEAVELSYRLTNLGAASAVVPEVRLMFSTNDTITTRDTLLETIPGGRGAPLEGRRTFQASLAPGDYFLGAVVDATDQVGETREDNNTAAAGLTVIPAQQQQPTQPAPQQPAAQQPAAQQPASQPQQQQQQQTAASSQPQQGGSTAQQGGSTTQQGGSTTQQGGSTAQQTQSGSSGQTAAAATAQQTTTASQSVVANAAPPGRSGGSSGCTLAGPGQESGGGLLVAGLFALLLPLRSRFTG